MNVPERFKAEHIFQNVLRFTFEDKFVSDVTLWTRDGLACAKVTVLKGAEGFLLLQCKTQSELEEQVSLALCAVASIVWDGITEEFALTEVRDFLLSEKDIKSHIQFIYGD